MLEEKSTTEDETVVSMHHCLDGHVFEQALGVGDGQGGLACCGPRGCRESDTTERLNENLVDLQCCVNGCWITKGFVYTYIYCSYSFPLWFIIGYQI